jgi:hypothetical protein
MQLNGLSSLDPEEQELALRWLIRLRVPPALFYRSWIPPEVTVPEIKVEKQPNRAFIFDSPDLSPLKPEELRAAALAGVGIRAWRESPASFSELGPYLIDGVALSIEGSVSWWSDWQVLQAAKSLTHLKVVGDPPETFRVEALKGLSYLDVQGETWNSSFGLPRLLVLHLSTSSRAAIGKISAPLATLSIESGRPIHDLDFLADASGLRTLFIHKAGRFDAASLLNSPLLEEFYLTRAVGLQNARALRELQNLRRLRLYAVREVDEPFAIADLDLDELEIDRNTAFDESFRAEVKGRPNWFVSPLRGSQGAGDGKIESADFEIRSVQDGSTEVVFSAWEKLRDRANRIGLAVEAEPQVGDSLVLNLLRGTDHVAFVHDSDGDSSILICNSRPSADLLVAKLVARWNHLPTFRAALLAANK